MRQYKFELILEEGNDEFWESLGNKSGCDEVREMLTDMLAQQGFYPDMDNPNCTLTLIEFKQ